MDFHFYSRYRKIDGSIASAAEFFESKIFHINVYYAVPESNSRKSSF